jgi:hypothetical protein
VRLPDFIIGGAPRSGTTWLYWLLDRHPTIHMARPVTPEPKFFLDDRLYDKGLRFYADTWFSEVAGDVLAGEKSTDYLESAPAAERIARDLPDIRLIFILREPADRAFSNYLWTRMNGLETENFADALRLEDRREAELPGRLKFVRPFAYFSRGLYADLLTPYFNRFRRDRILVLRFEDIARDPRRVGERVHRFLGLAPRPDDTVGLGKINSSENNGVIVDEAIRRELRARYAEPNRRLESMLGPDFPLWEE